MQCLISLIQAWYLGYGTRDVFEGVCSKLNERIAIELDGKALDLPELEGIVLLNITSWSSGCNLWAGSGLEDLPAQQRLVFVTWGPIVLLSLAKSCNVFLCFFQSVRWYYRSV